MVKFYIIKSEFPRDIIIGIEENFYQNINMDVGYAKYAVKNSILLPVLHTCSETRTKRQTLN